MSERVTGRGIAADKRLFIDDPRDGSNHVRRSIPEIGMHGIDSAVDHRHADGVPIGAIRPRQIGVDSRRRVLERGRRKLAVRCDELHVGAIGQQAEIARMHRHYRRPDRCERQFVPGAFGEQALMRLLRGNLLELHDDVHRAGRVHLVQVAGHLRMSRKAQTRCGEKRDDELVCRFHFISP